jgi:hypothetical protein
LVRTTAAEYEKGEMEDEKVQNTGNLGKSGWGSFLRTLRKKKKKEIKKLEW